jgi:chromosome segregation ATPase
MTSPRKIISSAVLFLVLLAVSAAVFFYVRETPRYSMYLLKRALLAQNMEDVLKYADLDRIADSVVERAFKKVEKGGVAEGGSSERSGKKAFLTQALPSLKKNLREQAQNQLISYLKDEKVREAIKKTTVWMVQIRQEAGKAYVSHGGKERFVMEQASGGYWRVVDVLWE